MFAPYMVTLRDIKREGFTREGLLTERERWHLNNSAIDRRILSKLHKKLDKRINAFIDDLNIIFSSNHLKPWVALHKENIDEIKLKLYEFKIPNSQPIYRYPIRFYTKNIGKGKVTVYYLDKKHPYTVPTKRLFEPSFALRKIKDRLEPSFALRKIKDKRMHEILLQAYDREKLPESKEKALNLEALEQKLKLS